MRLLLYALLSTSIAIIAAPVPVTNTNSSGPGSLDNAITTALAGDTIVFQIPGTGPFVIIPTSDLPDINKQLTIDGYTQTGAAPANGLTPATILIEIQAPNSTIAGLHFVAGSSGSVVKGLAINSCTFTPAILIEESNIVVSGNYLGMNAQGTTSLPNMAGVIIFQADNNTIGGLPSADRNIISGVNQSLNANPFVLGSGANVAVIGNNNSVIGNYIGTNPAGTAALGVSEVGVFVYTGNINDITNNLISGNTMAGIVLGNADRFGQQGSSLSSTRVENNRIGTDVSGLLAIPNGFGISLCGNADNTVFTENTISGNLYAGIQIGTFAVNQQFGDNPPVQGPTTLTLNNIGTDLPGVNALPNNSYGVVINEATSNTTVGSNNSALANIISANRLHGISISSQATFNTVVGNKIGVNKTTTQALGNQLAGISIGGLTKAASNNAV